MAKRKQDLDFDCPVEVTLDVIGGKWKGMIIFQLSEGTARFNEMRRAMAHVTQRMLTAQLRELERDGVLTRTVYPEVPPRVEYELTDFGRGLVPIIRLMETWGERYREQLRPAG
ncbi:winged helix-turn-helix transcriptional regulator [Nocardia alba]|uniref:HxlR family transcriptional regulator n=1 Tax=Nocardia alba TaxID=225051 RepID=A0A4R1FGM6_9NOCA|nr:helix-turn-helix domain-containing protein [Nocardia alba]TCJ93493.1 HxlR family transcriptional regulator [Nocardia alba]